MENNQGNTFKPWRSGDPYYYDMPKKGDPWEETFKLVQKFDEEMCRGWREEIDTLLVFAGLFSAAVTAFTIESYHWLQEDPDKISNQILTQISIHLVSLNSINTTAIPSASKLQVSDPFTGSTSAIRINAFWFTSLTLGLTAVLIGILCKQWLREYQRYENLSPKDAFPIRQMRYEGLLRWHIPKILSTLPLLLQVALVLFFGGLLDLLWHLNQVVASVVTAVVGTALTLVVITTILPFLQYLFHFSGLRSPIEPDSQCAFKSPQSWAFHLLGIWTVGFYGRIRMKFLGGTAVNYLQLALWLPDPNWVKYDLRWQARGRYVERGISWFNKTFAQNLDAIHSIYHCLENLDLDIAAGSVSRIIKEAWSPIVPFAGLILPTSQYFARPDLHNENTKQATQDLVLASYLVIHHRADASLSLRCVELCSRILNNNISMGGEDSSSIILEFLNVVLARALLTEELFAQLSSSIMALLDHDQITNTDISTFWDIFNNVLRQYPGVGPDPGPRRPAYALLDHVGQWLQRSMNSELSAADKHYRVMICSRGISGTYWSLQAKAELKQTKKLPEFQAAELLVRHIDEIFASIGGASTIMSPWGTDSWGLAKDEFLDYKNATSTQTHGTHATNPGVGHHNLTGPGTGAAPMNEPYNTGPGGFGGNAHHQETVTGTGILGQGQGRHAPGNHMQAQYPNDGYGGTTQPTMGTMGNHHGGLPPTGALNNSDQTRGGSGHALTGKVERTVGSMVGSNALKAKGLQKEQEANAIKVQGSELAEAERLEREALMRRERAVGHGAHPDNKHLGAGFNSGAGAGGAGGTMPGGY
ncbi:hypothetical protein BDZ94DRAFT_1318466 [Collybia nuda]|uniref:DUF6535 domain-containing protein n=1 Tax=Collybia nuda TaxID=64659 RepID=A0A9P5YHY6_9AGAR|nr:hypothetical protein BDZ94DRAFT_1318466 [Collybia nuda]